MRLCRSLFAVLLPFLLCCCEKVDFGEENGALPSKIEEKKPLSVGQGTQESPYTVGQVLQGGLPTGLNWFVGYVVGSTYKTMANCLFEGETTYTSNILLSADSLCQSSEECIPVELKSTTLQKSLSLCYNSVHFRQCVMLQGRVGVYFRCNGIRELGAGYWLDGFDISFLPATSPIEWEEREEEY